MTLEQAQEKVNHWIRTTGVKYFGELTNLGILMEEVGEFSRLMVRMYGEQSFKEKDAGNPKNASPDQQKEILADEMADVLWVLLCLANQTGINLTDALEKNFEKKNTRDVVRHQENEKLK